MDTLSASQRSACMARVKSKNTRPELLVRRHIHKLGLRYRLHVSDLPGKPDMVFRKHKKIIFIHGCFWHRHLDKNCKLSRLPKSRVDFWTGKLEGNQKRDSANIQELRSLGWDVLVIWECELSKSGNFNNTITNYFNL